MADLNRRLGEAIQPYVELGRRFNAAVGKALVEIAEVLTKVQRESRERRLAAWHASRHQRTARAVMLPTVVRERAIGRAAINAQFVDAYRQLDLEVPTHLVPRTDRKKLTHG